MVDAAEPAARAIEAAFSRIAESMAALPICNPRLAVEVVGVRPWGDVWLSVLVTPWTVSLMLTPRGQASGLRRLLCDEKQRWRFPSGDYEFLGGHEPEVGSYQTCSLVSPTGALGSQQEARDLGLAALEALLAEPVAATAPSSPVPPPVAAPPPPSRRAFLSLGRSR